MTEKDDRHTRIVKKVVRSGETIPQKSADSSSMLMLGLGAALLTQLAVMGRNHMMRWQDQINQAMLREKFGIKIVDNFLPDSDLKTRVQNETLWRACDKITASGSKRLWYYPGNEPVNVFEELAVKIYKDTEVWDIAVSYEYWCNIMEEQGKEWPWHTDRDEDVLDKERKLVFPLKGAVFYGFNESYEGANFYMLESVPYNRGTRESGPQDECDAEFCVSNVHLFNLDASDVALSVPTHYNRLLFANVTHYHKVTALEKGRRFALAVNANHWIPYHVEQAPSNDGLIEVAEDIMELEPRTFGLA